MSYHDEEKIEFVNINQLINRSEENEIIDEINRNEFFKLMSEHGFDHNTLRRLFENKRISANEQINFNNALRMAKQKIFINIYESIIYLDECFIKIKKILSFLDGDTKYILKKELSDKYKIQLNKNELWKIL
jgi:hypothetical protein